MDLGLVGRGEEALRDVVVSVDGQGVVDVLRCDLGHGQGLDQMGGRLDECYPRLDVLVPSAGEFRMGPWADLDAWNLDELYRVNFRVPIILTQALLPALQAARGQIVFLNSSAALQMARDWGAYAAFKIALKQFADSLRQEVNAQEISVLRVFPGRTATRMQQRIFAEKGRD